MAETLRIVEHLNVIEHYIGRGVGGQLFVKSLQFFVGVDVPETFAAMQPVIDEFGRNGWPDKGVNRVDKLKFPAKLANKLVGPAAARFPEKLQSGPVGGLEKVAQVGNIWFGRLEPGRTLEKNAPGFEGLGAFQGGLPGLPDQRAIFERTGLPALLVRKRQFQPPVSLAPGFVGNQLPGFEGELEVRWHLGPPALHGFEHGRLVESLLNFYDREKSGVFGTGGAKAATTYFYSQVAFS